MSQRERERGREEDEAEGEEEIGTVDCVGRALQSIAKPSTWGASRGSEVLLSTVCCEGAICAAVVLHEQRCRVEPRAAPLCQLVRVGVEHREDGRRVLIRDCVGKGKPQELRCATQRGRSE